MAKSNSPGDSGKPGGTKPPDNPSSAKFNEIFSDPLYPEFLHEVLNSGVLESEFVKFKEHKHNPPPQGSTKKEPFNPQQSRTAIGRIVTDILQEPLQEMLGPYERQTEQLQAVLVKFKEQLKAINAALYRSAEKGTDSKVDRIQQQVADLHKEMFRFSKGSYQESDSERRFQDEFPLEKRAIAHYVVDHYFRAPMHCFFQASTTAFHVADVLTHRNVGDGCVIHTNSFALPHMLLRRAEPSPISVYPVSGQHPDFKCAGWLYGHDDDDADKYLKGLFSPDRGNHVVTTAFVTPQYVDIQGNCYFARHETLNLVKAILERAKQIVVLTPGPRIFKSKRDIPNPGNIVNWNPIKLDLAAERWNAANPGQAPLESLRWIVAGEFSQLDATEVTVFDDTRRRLNSHLVTAPPVGVN